MGTISPPKVQIFHPPLFYKGEYLVEYTEEIDYTTKKVEGYIKICPKCGKPGFSRGLPKNYYIHKEKQRHHNETALWAYPAEVTESCLIE